MHWMPETEISHSFKRNLNKDRKRYALLFFSFHVETTYDVHGMCACFILYLKR